MVWNPYRTRQQNERWNADFERATLRYESLPQPKIVDVRLDVDIQPHAPRVRTKGVYVIQNKTDKPLREIHIRFARDLKMRSLAVGGARPKLTLDALQLPHLHLRHPDAAGRAADHRLHHRAGAARLQELRQHDRDPATTGPSSTTARSPRRWASTATSFCATGPSAGARSLPSELRPPALGTPGAEQFHGLDHGSDFVNAQITVTTDADQTPIAPGYKVSDTVRDGRRTAVFRTDAPILRFFSVQSARYAVKQAAYKGVQIAVYYDPHHSWNVDRMIERLEALARLFPGQLQPLPVPPAAVHGVPGGAGNLRSVVRQHRAVVGGDRLHRRRPRHLERSTTSPMSGPTRSPTSGGPTRSSAPTSRAAPCWPRPSPSTPP